MHLSVCVLYFMILKVTKISSWKPTYFSVKKKNLISQIMHKRHVLLSDYIHKIFFWFFFLHRTKVQRHIVDCQPFCTNSKVCTLMVCHNPFPYWAHTWCLVSNSTNTLFPIYTMLQKHRDRLIVFSSIDFEGSIEQKIRSPSPPCTCHMSAKTFFIPYSTVVLPTGKQNIS